MPVASARRILGPSKIIGATTNILEDMVEAARDGADYIGLGPFRFTTTKARLAPTLGLDGRQIRDLQCRNRQPCVGSRAYNPFRKGQ